MATGFSPAPRKEGTWTKLVIFIALYCLILESILQWVLVLFLYGNHQVDSKMTPSLILSLVSSFLSIPLVSLQSLVAWQYNKIGGFGEQKTVLHNVCTYVLRLSLMLWLATCVSGLVVAAQQVYCLPSGTHATFWRVGASCAFHRASVIVSVVTLMTVCTLYCARELCDRPYDVSLIGIYKRSQALREGDGSIFSGHSWDSDETLKNEILNLCRQHDGKSGGEPWSNDPFADKINCHPSIRHPAPVRLRPQLRVNTNPGSEYGEITSGTTASPDDTVSRVSPGGTMASDFYPISRSSTVMTSQTACESRLLLSDVNIPKVPAIPEQYTSHKRQKSSLSSLRRFLPKSFPLSLPLSSDPQIRALADPNAASDVEKQVVTPSMTKESCRATTVEVVSSKGPDFNRSIKTSENGDSTDNSTAKSESHGRTFTMNSADAPEVVPEPVPAEPAKVCRSQTASFTPPRSIDHPHHPDHIPGPTNPRKYSSSCRRSSAALPLHVEPLRRPSSRQSSIIQQPIRSASYQFDRSHAPRHAQNQYRPQYYSQPTPTPSPTRWGSQRSFSPSHIIHTVPRRNDVEVIYPSTRRPRSSTHGHFSGPLSCIMESACSPRASVDETQFAVAAVADAPRNVIDQNTYRGTNRTSMSFY